MGRLVTDEHFVPEDGVTLEDYFRQKQTIAVHHLIRYRWAEAALDEVVPAGAILDVACGAGYGTYGIAKRFPHVEVIGADYDSNAIEFARQKYTAPNLRFQEADMTRWSESIGDGEFAHIISFDTIEHVAHREIALQNIVEHLQPSGSLLLSTPVRPATTLNPGWEHHKIEFSPVALYDFLRRYFEEVRAPDFSNLPCVNVFDFINKEGPTYLLRMNPVVCRWPIRFKFGA